MTRNKGLRKFILLEFLGSDEIFNKLIYIVFIGFLALLYIANSHFSEKKIRQIQVLQDEIKELRWEYMTLASENRVKAQRSQMADRFDVLGLRPFERRPYKLLVNSKKSY
ncbi:MAG: hypothetical protein KGQ86_02570 [Bacteroidetes bacterium]|jgi:hypothetical protein|nr:hypothetical protein [Bacteroidota bacterium]